MLRCGRGVFAEGTSIPKLLFHMSQTKIIVLAYQVLEDDHSYRFWAQSCCLGNPPKKPAPANPRGLLVEN